MERPPIEKMALEPVALIGSACSSDSGRPGSRNSSEDHSTNGSTMVVPKEVKYWKSGLHSPSNIELVASYLKTSFQYTLENTFQ